MTNLIPYLESLITVLNDMKDEMKRSAAVDLGQYSPDLDRQLRQYELDHLTKKRELGAATYDDMARIGQLKEYLSKSNKVADTVIDSVRKAPPPGPAIIGETAPEMTAASKRDWEVLELKNKADGTIDKIAGRPVNIEWWNLDEWPIHRVRRLSDGVEFAVGQMVENAQTGLCGRIEKFEIGNIEITMGIMFAKFTDSKGTLCTKSLGNIRMPKPLFTTADGVDHYDENDFIWILFTSDGRIEQKAFRQIDPIEWGAGKPELYDTKEAAEAAYNKWLYGQRVLSLDDVNIGADLDELVKQRVK